MKKSEYINAIDNVIIQDNEKAEIWQSISSTGKAETPSSRKISVKRIVAVAAAAVCITVIATPVVSSGVESLLSKYRSDSQTVSEKVEVDIFEDSDGHVKITVEEMLSDVQSVYMIVSYEALDEIGEEWLASKDFKQTIYDSETDTLFRAGMTILPSDSQSCSYGNFEIEDKKTVTQRWFYVTYEGSQGVESSDSDLFGYYMTDGTRTAYLDTTGNIETYTYELSSEESPSEFFVPRYLTISDISFSIFADNTGVYEHFSENGRHGIRTLISEEQRDEIHNSLYFITEDEYKFPAGVSGGLGDIESDTLNMQCDLNLAYGQHRYYNEESHNLEYRNIDAEKIVGLEIMGVYYELK